jgi:aspartate-semialdehyde dehydrogenase
MGDTEEETKLLEESRKILHVPGLRVTATAVRVPVFVGHSESVNLEFGGPVEPLEARQALSRAPGVVILDEPSAGSVPTPRIAAGKDDVFVGRIRRDASVPHGLNLWLVTDNLRKGAATNAVQIAEALIAVK